MSASNDRWVVLGGHLEAAFEAADSEFIPVSGAFPVLDPSWEGVDVAPGSLDGFVAAAEDEVGSLVAIQAAADTEVIPVPGAFPVLDPSWEGVDVAAGSIDSATAADEEQAQSGASAAAFVAADGEVIPVSGAFPVLDPSWEGEDVAAGSLASTEATEAETFAGSSVAAAMAAQGEDIPVDGTVAAPGDPPTGEGVDVAPASFEAPDEDATVAIAAAADGEVIPVSGAFPVLEPQWVEEIAPGTLEAFASSEEDAATGAAIAQMAAAGDLPPAPAITCLTLKAGVDADDGYWDDGAGSGFVSSHSDNFIGDAGGSGPYSAWWRFPNVTIPQGATITSATLTLTSDDTQANDNVKATFRAILEANPGTLTSNANAKSRTRTTASVASGNIGHWVPDTVFTSADFTTVLQEVVNQGAFASGNAVVILAIDAGSSATAFRSFYSHDSGQTTKEAVLSACYSTVAAAVTDQPAISEGDGAELLVPDDDATVALATVNADNEAIPVQGAFPVLESPWDDDTQLALVAAPDDDAATAIAMAADSEVIPVSGAAPVLDSGWEDDTAIQLALFAAAEEATAPSAYIAIAVAAEEIPVDGTVVVVGDSPVGDGTDVAPGSFESAEADAITAALAAIEVAREEIPVQGAFPVLEPPWMDDVAPGTFEAYEAALAEVQAFLIAALVGNEGIPESGPLPPPSGPGPTGSARTAARGPGGVAYAAAVGPSGSASSSNRGPSGSARWLS